MTNQSPESVIAEVIEYHADTIGTHWDGCYKRHAVCLAVKLRDMLREPGEPDAALAAIERVRDLANSLRVRYADNSDAAYFTKQFLAALDGAPEPEWEYGYRGRYAVMHPTKAGQRIETPEITQRTPDNWLPEMGEIYRRRPSTPAGPWLPVEGESDD